MSSGEENEKRSANDIAKVQVGHVTGTADLNHLKKKLKEGQSLFYLTPIYILPPFSKHLSRSIPGILNNLIRM